MTSTTVYVPLLDEGTTCWRPTQAIPLGADVYRLLPTPNYDPEDEVWQFAPGTRVRCAVEKREGVDRLIVQQALAEVAADAPVQAKGRDRLYTCLALNAGLIALAIFGLVIWLLTGHGI